LEASGASLIAVHARYRGTPTHRRDGPAHLEQVTAIKRVLRVPVLANGNVRSWQDVVANLASTGADGIMSAEGMLDDPCLFAHDCLGAESRRAELRKVEKKLRQVQSLRERHAQGTALSSEELEKVGRSKALRRQRKQLLAEQGSAEGPPSLPQDGLAKVRCYLDMARRHEMPPLRTVIFHCRRMAKAELARFQLLEEFTASPCLEAAEAVLARAESYQAQPQSFVLDEGRARRERELGAQKAYELECRKKYEARIARKAKQSGRPLSELLRPSAVPGGLLSFGAEPSWLLERDGEATEGQSRPRGRGRGRG